MCQLLLIISNKNVRINLSWRALQDRANYNPHGWGAAWKLRDGSFRINKKPEKLPGGIEGMQLVKGIKTSQFLAHVRYRVSGAVSRENTQPFANPQNSYAFAATMSQCKVINRYRNSVRKFLKGRTGPEVLFQLFLNKYKKDIEDEKALSKLIKDVFINGNLKKRASASFVLMLNGRAMAYRYGKRLYYLERKPPHGAEVTLLSRKGYTVNLSSEKGPKDIVTLIASERLTDEKWKLLSEKVLFEVTAEGVQSVA
jgi:predicted glutamine amidotransferase